MNHIVVGDLHGCGIELQLLLDAIDREYEPDQVELIFLGDLFTKGPRPDLVTSAIHNKRRQGTKVTLICGNHEIRLLGAIGRLRSGLKRERLPRQDREAIGRLEEAGMLNASVEMILDAARRIDLTITDYNGTFTVLHAGIEPALGLAATPDHLKMHMKARKGEQDWWDRYDGSDGLIIFGHKPVPEPLVVRDDFENPIAINLDTGCIHGGHLTAYNVQENSFLQIRSKQPINKSRLEFALSPTVAPTEQRLASGGPARTSAG